MFLTIVDETGTELPFTNHTRRWNEVQGAGVTKFSQRINPMLLQEIFLTHVRVLVRLIRDREKGGGGEGFMEVGERETIIPIAALSPPE